MKVFSWQGIDINGKIHKGEFESESVDKLKQTLLEQGIALTSAREKKISKQSRFSFLSKKISLKDKIYFFNSIALLLRGGDTVFSSLKIMLHHTRSKELRRIIDSLIVDINHGLNFSSALAKHPRVFSSLVINMVASGEGVGRLDIICEQIALYLQNNFDIRKKINNAIFLPLATLIFAFFIVVLILTLIVPRFQLIFSGLDQPIPNITRFIFKLSEFIRSWGLLLIFCIVLCLYLLFKALLSNYLFKKLKDRLILRIYFLHRIVLIFNFVLFIKSLIVQLSCGIKLHEAIKKANLVISNLVLRDKIDLVASQIDKGGSFAESMELLGESYFPGEFIAAVSVGERSGRLKNMLENVQGLFEQELTSKLSFMMSILQPVLIVFVGCIIGFILIAVYTPIFNLASSI